MGHISKEGRSFTLPVARSMSLGAGMDSQDHWSPSQAHIAQQTRVSCSICTRHSKATRPQGPLFGLASLLLRYQKIWQCPWVPVRLCLLHKAWSDGISEIVIISSYDCCVSFLLSSLCLLTVHCAWRPFESPNHQLLHDKPEFHSLPCRGLNLYVYWM
jgi:hypothetical protein